MKNEKKKMPKHSETSQIAMVLNHLKTGEEINPLQALSLYGAYRLGAIIFDLKDEGYNIVSRIEYFEKSNGRQGRYAVYRLEA